MGRQPKITFRRISVALPEHMDFISEHHDGFIAVAKDPYKNDPSSPNHIMFEARHGKKLVGIGFVTIPEDRKTHCSIMVVHHDYRGQGLASELTRLRVEAVSELGIPYTTEALVNNLPSIKALGKHLKPDGEPKDGIQKFGSIV